MYFINITIYDIARGDTMSTLFSKIIAGEIPSTKIYEDDTCVAILDIYPNAKGHTLVIPKQEVETMLECPEALLQHLIVVVKNVGEKQMRALGCAGFNVIVNNKPAAGQEIPHLHFHVIPRYEHDGHSHGFGKVAYDKEEIETYGKKLQF